MFISDLVFAGCILFPLWILESVVAVGHLVESASAGLWVAERNRGALGEKAERDLEKS